MAVKALAALALVIAIATWISGYLAIGIMVGVGFTVVANIHAILTSRTF